MIDPADFQDLKQEIEKCVEADRSLLAQLCSEIDGLRNNVHRIRPRRATSVSFVAADGGNNQLRFDPFLIQIIRVVDSSNEHHCLEFVTPHIPVARLDERHLTPQGMPQSALGEMMRALGVESLAQLSPMIRDPAPGKPRSVSWVQVYRELTEWAVLFRLLSKDFATDTLVLMDGYLRSKVFSKDFFSRLLKKIEERVNSHYQRMRRKIYLAGIAKKSKVLDRYRLAMAMQGILQTPYPAYVEVPREIEVKAYEYEEYARGDDMATAEGEANKFVGGKLFFAKFGDRIHDDIWPIDIFLPQTAEADAIMGFLLTEAQDGFPVPYYPRCLQKAHENAALHDFDFELLQDAIFEAIRSALGEQARILDVFDLKDKILSGN